MNPLGIALAFLAFGLVSGLGVFMVVNTVPAIAGDVRTTNGMGKINDSLWQQGGAMVIHASLFLLGIAFILAGAYATYVVIYG